MLNVWQEKYLSELPPEKANEIIHILPYNPGFREIMSKLVTKIKEKLSKTKVIFHGSAALEIAGMDDIDVAVISSGSFELEEQGLTELFGKPSEKYPGRYSFWEFEEDGVAIELTLNEDLSDYQIKEHLETFEKLKNSEDLKAGYEAVKLRMDKKPYKEYMKVKLEFLNSIQ